MIQFDVKRFGMLARWTLTKDRGYYVKTFLQMLVVSALMFIAFTTRFFTFVVNGNGDVYAPCGVIVIAVIIVQVIVGPSLIFYNYKNKQDDQALLMLPASNFEKYLMHYASWIILLLLYLVALLTADLLQYLVNVMIGNEHATLVITFLASKMGALGAVFTEMPTGVLYFLIFMLLLVHSAYALGGTFFRSHKYAWIITTLGIILISMLWGLFLPRGEIELNEHTTMLEFVIWDSIYVVWTLVNFWLSYKLFCRTQVMGKFVNI